MFFRDIFRVSIDVLDHQNRVISDLDRVLSQQQEHGESLKISFVLKIHYMISSQDENDESKETDSMAGFRVGRHEIQSKTKDFKVMKRILRTLQSKQK